MGNRVKHTLIGTEIVKYLADNSYRIFNHDLFSQIVESLGYNPNYATECIYHLQKNNWIMPIKKGLYQLAPCFLNMSIHEYEIAMHLIEPASIGFWSAFHHHNLTEQIPHTIFIRREPENQSVFSGLDEW